MGGRHTDTVTSPDGDQPDVHQLLDLLGNDGVLQVPGGGGTDRRVRGDVRTPRPPPTPMAYQGPPVTPRETLGTRVMPCEVLGTPGDTLWRHSDPSNSLGTPSDAM